MTKSFHYSNEMFALVGAIASNVVALNGSNPFLGWRTLVQEKIFDQLGMKSATVDFDTYMSLNSSVEAFYIRVPSNSSEYKFHVEAKNSNELFMKNHPSAGAIAMNIKDYSKWMMYLLEMSQKGKSSMAKLVSKKNYDFIFAPHNNFSKVEGIPESPSYGLGTYISEYKGYKIVYHSGHFIGQYTTMCLLPDHGYGMAAFANTDYAPGDRYACEDILDLFMLNQDLSQAGNKTLGLSSVIVESFNATDSNNTKLIQKHSLLPVATLPFPKTAYLGSFNFTESKVSEYSTTMVSETPFRLKFRPRESYDSCVMTGFCLTLQHFGGNQFIEIIDNVPAPANGIYTFEFEAGKFTSVNRTAPAI